MFVKIIGLGVDTSSMSTMPIRTFSHQARTRARATGRIEPVTADSTRAFVFLCTLLHRYHIPPSHGTITASVPLGERLD